VHEHVHPALGQPDYCWDVAEDQHGATPAGVRFRHLPDTGEFSAGGPTVYLFMVAFLLGMHEALRGGPKV